jgi:DNA-binding NtrC family response regulator
MAGTKQVKTILIVDDTAVIRGLLTELLESEGYDIVCANDGIEALEIIESKQVDLVFCDIHMPRRNGLDTLKKSKEIRPGLLFVMTDSLPDEMAEAAQSIGAISCISKPFDLDEIRSSVRQAEALYSEGKNVERITTR